MKFDKVVFINGNAVGDVVLSTAVIKAFCEQFPHSHITFLVRPETAPLVTGLSFIDEVVCYEKGAPMIPVLKKIWRSQVAICLDFKYRSAVIPFLGCIPVRVGLAHKRKLFLTHPVLRDVNEENIYEPQNQFHMIEQSLGIKLPGNPYSLYVSPASESEKAKVKHVLADISKGKLKIAIAPFSSNPAKDWSIHSYQLLIEKLQQKYEIEFLLLGSDADRKKGLVDIEHVHDLRGKTNLAELAEVLRHADYFIGSCSGPLHIAAAAKLPIVALYGATSAKYWAPQIKTIVLQHEVACSPCDRRGYDCQANYRCMQLITVDEVYQACEQMMESYPKRSAR